MNHWQLFHSHLVTTSLHIFIAEDNPQELELLEEALRECAPQVNLRVVGDGPSALEELSGPESISFHLVVLDARLPVLETRELLPRLPSAAAAEPFLWPVVVLSSLMLDEEKSEFLRLGASAVFNKPMDLAEYHELAEQLLDLAGRQQ